jgi:hypothetical protein
MATHRIRYEEIDEIMAESHDLYEENLWSVGADDIESSDDNDYIPPTPPEQRNRVTAPIICISAMTQRQLMTSQTVRMIVAVMTVTLTTLTGWKKQKTMTIGPRPTLIPGAARIKICPPCKYQTCILLSSFMTTFLNSVVTETNKYAQQFLQTHRSLSRSHSK